MELMGVDIRTIVTDTDARRCDGCRAAIAGTPWRISILDIVAAERPADWSEQSALNPGPFQFHSDEACVRTWMARRGHLFCRRGRVREIMRPVPIPAAEAGAGPRFGLCDGFHRDDHEFVPA